MAERKNKPTVPVEGADIEQRRREAEEAERLAMQAEMKSMMTAKIQEFINAPSGRVGRPTKMKVSIASKRPLQISTHYTYDVKEQIEDVVRRMKREGIKTASNEEVIFIAVSQWLDEHASHFTADEFLRYREEVER